MQFEDFSFGSIRIDGITHEHNVVIEAGQIRKRKKKPSRKFRFDFGHTPLSIEEDIPWNCRPLATATGALERLQATASSPNSFRFPNNPRLNSIPHSIPYPT